MEAECFLNLFKELKLIKKGVHNRLDNNDKPIVVR